MSKSEEQELIKTQLAVCQGAGRGQFTRSSPGGGGGGWEFAQGASAPPGEVNHA